MRLKHACNARSEHLDRVCRKVHLLLLRRHLQPRARVEHAGQRSNAITAADGWRHLRRPANLSATCCHHHGCCCSYDSSHCGACCPLPPLPSASLAISRTTCGQSRCSHCCRYNCCCCWWWWMAGPPVVQRCCCCCCRAAARRALGAARRRRRLLLAGAASAASRCPPPSPPPSLLPYSPSIVCSAGLAGELPAGRQSGGCVRAPEAAFLAACPKLG